MARRKVEKVKLDATLAEQGLIALIAERAHTLALLHKIDATQQDIEMDITAVNCNGCPLRLRALLTTDDANFGHDVWGIRRFLNRSTGKLDGHFVPRFAA